MSPWVRWVCIAAASALHVDKHAPAAPPQGSGAGHGEPAGGNASSPFVPWRLPTAMRAKSAEGLGYPRQEVVNLDLRPKQRWVHIMAKYRDELIPYLEDWQDILDEHLEIDQAAWGNATFRALKKQYLHELQGIVETLNHPKVTMRSLLLFNMMYDMGSPMGCSELLAAAKDGTVLHGRNLDYRVIAPTIEIAFYRWGRLVAVSPTFLGQVGFHTVISPGAWSFGQNTRHDDQHDSVPMNLQRLRAGAKIWSILARESAVRGHSYARTKARLERAPLTRAMYLILAGAGPYEGVVFARAADPRFKHVNALSPRTHDWYVFQTNDDLGSFPRDFRRPAEALAMSVLTQDGVNPQNVVKAMRMPVVYADSNVVLFMMAPKSGKYCTILGPINPAGLDHSVSGACRLDGWHSARGSTFLMDTMRMLFSFMQGFVSLFSFR